MRVVITEAQLKAAQACPVYLNSPEWDAGEKALVYADWTASVKRLLGTRPGTGYLDFLVARKLVPMTTDEFIAARHAARTPGGG